MSNKELFLIEACVEALIAVTDLKTLLTSRGIIIDNTKHKDINSKIKSHQKQSFMASVAIMNDNLNAEKIDAQAQKAHNKLQEVLRMCNEDDVKMYFEERSKL